MVKNKAVEMAQLRRSVFIAISGAPRQISNRQIATACGVSDSTVHRVLTRPHDVNIETIAQIYDGLVSMGLIDDGAGAGAKEIK